MISNNWKQQLKHLFADVTEIPEFINHTHYHSLNGLRGISIIMVVFMHMQLSGSAVYVHTFNGKLGVNIFFVISGFLITTLCLKEKVKTAGLDLKNFYIRRALRIIPVAYLFLILVAVFNKALHLNQSYFYILSAALYLVDFSYFKQFNNSYTGHFWSLAVEEQFYLIFPFILKKNFRIYLSLVLFIVFVLPLILWLQAYVAILNKGALYFITHFFVKFQGIAVGSLFAVLTFKGFFKPINSAIVKTSANCLAIVLIVYLDYDDFFSLKATIVNLGISLLTGFIIISNITPAKDIIFRLLNSKALNLVGILSYSIYIWHLVFITPNPYLPHVLYLFPYNVVFLLIVSSASYFLYEKYFLKLKSRFSKIKPDAKASL